MGQAERVEISAQMAGSHLQVHDFTLPEENHRIVEMTDQILAETETGYGIGIIARVLVGVWIDSGDFVRRIVFCQINELLAIVTVSFKHHSHDVALIAHPLKLAVGQLGQGPRIKSQLQLDIGLHSRVNRRCLSCDGMLDVFVVFDGLGGVV
ncbi:MAG: hypothetical protein MJE77_30255 [Proteobacteria bacterium]|nr:hypothetical protein [Pseudomonadota bacterium]